MLDKIVRLGGPFVIYSVLLGPAMDLWISSYGGVSVLSWQYIMGPPWFGTTRSPSPPPPPPPALACLALPTWRQRARRWTDARRRPCPRVVLWLLNFSLIYAAVAHIAPKGRQCASPRPLLVVGGALALAAVLCQAGLRCGLAWVRARIVAYASNYMQATSGLG